MSATKLLLSRRVILELIRHNKQIINGEDEDGNTSLHLAALAGHENVLKILSEVGANVEARLLVLL